VHILHFNSEHTCTLVGLVQTVLVVSENGNEAVGKTVMGTKSDYGNGMGMEKKSWEWESKYCSHTPLARTDYIVQGPSETVQSMRGHKNCWGGGPGVFT